MTPEELQEVIRLHGMWLRGEAGGVCANLRHANLRHANLWSADLRKADLQGADLWGADLQGADLGRADLRNADLRNADLRNADLRNANLRDADLRNANLRDADLGNGPLTSPKVFTWSSNYHAMTFDTESGRWLRYGCETRTLDQWDAEVEGLCRKHEPCDAERYEAEIRALVALCRVVDLGGGR